MTSDKGEGGTDRGKRASFDPRTGAVSGSGAGAGGNPDASEDYDSDLHGQAAVETSEAPSGGR